MDLLKWTTFPGGKVIGGFGDIYKVTDQRSKQSKQSVFV
jgi:hypothetical protein